MEISVISIGHQSMNGRYIGIGPKKGIEVNLYKILLWIFMLCNQGLVKSNLYTTLANEHLGKLFAQL